METYIKKSDIEKIFNKEQHEIIKVICNASEEEETYYNGCLDILSSMAKDLDLDFIPYFD